jgi:hypothetical protein
LLGKSRDRARAGPKAGVRPDCFATGAVRTGRERERRRQGAGASPGRSNGTPRWIVVSGYFGLRWETTRTQILSFSVRNKIQHGGHFEAQNIGEKPETETIPPSRS